MMQLEIEIAAVVGRDSGMLSWMRTLDIPETDLKREIGAEKDQRSQYKRMPQNGLEMMGDLLS